MIIYTYIYISTHILYIIKLDTCIYTCMYTCIYNHITMCVYVYMHVFLCGSIPQRVHDPGTPLEVNSVTAPEGTARVWRKLAMAMVPLALMAVAYHHSIPGWARLEENPRKDDSRNWGPEGIKMYITIDHGLVGLYGIIFYWFHDWYIGQMDRLTSVEKQSNNHWQIYRNSFENR